MKRYVEGISIAIFLTPSLALAHMAGDDSPLPFETKRIQTSHPAVTSSFNPGAVEGVVDEFRLWRTGSVLQTCFFNGSQEMKEFVIKAARDIGDNGNLKFNFGNPPEYNKCGSLPYSIRVKFNPADGHWSYVGTDSQLINADLPSLNLGFSPNTNLAVSQKEEIYRVALHEFGHAIAMEHEHQSPESNCENEFDWPKVYAVFKQKYNWDQQKVDTNLRGLVDSPRYRTTAYDRKSIMHYYFSPWMYKNGQNSSCYIQQNYVLSDLDKQSIHDAYPATPQEQLAVIQKRADTASAVLNKLQLTDTQKEYVKSKIDTSAGMASPGFSFSFSSNINQTDCSGASITTTTGNGSPVTICSNN